MIEKNFCSVIEEFEDDYFFEENDFIEDFLEFCSMKFRFLGLDSVSGDCVDKFLFMWLPDKIIDPDNGDVERYVDAVNMLSEYINKKYNINIGEKNENDISEIKRICRINREFKKFLCDPVISYSPLIIDFDIYKKRKDRVDKRCFFNVVDKGYFTVEEFFSKECILLKKMYTGRFIKAALDKNVLREVRKKDILYAGLRQNPFFSWEFVELYKYYPSNVIEYINAS